MLTIANEVYVPGGAAAAGGHVCKANDNSVRLFLAFVMRERCQRMHDFWASD